MEIIEQEINGRKILQVDSWIERGIFHGFLGADTPVDNPSQRWTDLFPDQQLSLLKQNHGKTRIIFSKETAGEKSGDKLAEGDAWLVRFAKLSDELQNFAAGILTADCFPVLILSKNSELGACVHCGWRGASAGILVETLVALTREGAPARSLEIAIGPGAQSESYEIGYDVEKKMHDAYEFVNSPSTGIPSPVIRKGEKRYCSISNLLQAQAVFCGIPKTQIAVSPIDTITNENFFSHRRQGEAAGRQVAFIGKR